MSKSGYDEKTFEAFENMLGARQYATEQLQKIANLLAKNTITYEEAIRRIKFDEKSVDLAKWRYKQEISKLTKVDINKLFEN